MAEDSPRPGKWRRRLVIPVTIAVIALLVTTLVLRKEIFITIDAGQVGVLWSRFGGGTITDKTYGEGMHAILPWNKMYQYSLRFQKIEESFVTLSSEGLAIETTIVTRYKPTAESIAEMHKNIGPDFVDVLIKPEIAATAREAIAKMSPADLYSERRGDIQNNIAKKLSRRIGLPPEFVDIELLDRVLDLKAIADAERAAREEGDSDDPKDRARKRRKKKGKAFPKDEDAEFVNIDEVLIEDVVLPETLGGAIEGKLAQQQADLEYVYRLQREAKEKQRKIIEAEGIAEFQRVTGGLSLLKWRAMDATLRLASAPNATLVVVGSRETDGLPLILGPLAGGEGTPLPAPAQQQSAQQQP